LAIRGYRASHFNKLSSAERPAESMLLGMVRGEFTVYPFIEGNALPPHVQVAIDAIKDAGLEVEVGPLSNTIAGPLDRVLEALHRAESAALSAGAQRILIRLEVEDE
jgi:uncharacterized protein YqgV (UPF0045/DUF77 family)